MPNVASVLKQEVARLARRELRAETDRLKKVTTQQRSDIAQLKRQVADLERRFSGLAKPPRNAAPPMAVDPAAADKIRFSAKGLKAHRQRLGLSVSQTARLLGVSDQTIYNWEAGTTRPRTEQIAMIAALRKIGKRQLAEHLSATADAKDGS